MSSTKIHSKRSTFSTGSNSSNTPKQYRRTEDAVSPARISRLQEKEELQHLNDRLAAYIDKVRHLEHENDRLLYQIHSSEETVKKEITNIKGIYETELADARKLLDEVSKEKAKLQIDAGKFKSLADDLSIKLGRRERELREVEKALSATEGELNDIRGKYNALLSDKKRFDEDNKQYRLDNLNLEKQLAVAKKQLEDETLMRVDLENRIQSLKEDLEFKRTIHDKEISEVRTRREMAIREIDDKLQQEYEHKLEDALKDMRFHHDRQIQAAKEEIEEMYQAKFADLQGTSQRDTDANNMLREEIYSLRSTEQDLKEKLRNAESSLLSAQSRVKDLEEMIEREKMDRDRSIRARDEEIKRLRETMSDYLLEYQELMDTKLALDMELAAYRKMLEGEEARLNLTPSSKSPSLTRSSVETQRSSTATTMGTAYGAGAGSKEHASTVAGSIHGTPTKQHHHGLNKSQSTHLTTGGGKRTNKRNYEETFEEDTFSTSFKATRGLSSQEHCDIEIAESDPDGLYVKLVNRSNKDIPLTGWTVARALKTPHNDVQSPVNNAEPVSKTPSKRRTLTSAKAAAGQPPLEGATDGTTVEFGAEVAPDNASDISSNVSVSGINKTVYKIGRGVVLKAKGGSLIIYSANAEHLPSSTSGPAHLVATLTKQQSWPVGDNYWTKLYNKDGQEISWHEASKTISSVKKSHARYTSPSAGQHKRFFNGEATGDEHSIVDGRTQNNADKCFLM